MEMGSSTAKKIFCAALIVCLLMISGASSAEAPDEVAWWENEMLIAEGYGLPPATAFSAGQARALAWQAAKSDAYRKLAHQAASIKITADTTMVEHDINAVIVGAQILSEEHDMFGGCTVVMSVPIYGVTNSVASAAFKPVEKEDFPAPSLESDEEAEGNYTGLIVDCGDLELNPVLAPAIQNADNQSIYSYRNLDYADVISNGIVSYVCGEIEEMPEVKSVEPDEPVESVEKVESVESVESVEHREIFVKPVEVRGINAEVLGASVPKNGSRAGTKPLVVKAVGLGADNSCPVLATSDADKILRENQASHFLNNGSVIFMSRRIRGMRL